MIRKQTKKWTMKNKRSIRICDMDDPHLINTINMLRRGACYQLARDDMLVMGAGLMQGEMAMMAMEDALLNSSNATWDDLVPEIYWNMMEDFERRELDPSKLKDPGDGHGIALRYFEKERGSDG